MYITKDKGNIYVDLTTKASNLILGTDRIQLNAGYATTAGNADKVAKSLTVKGNGTTSFTFDGSVAKTLNIKSGTNVTVNSDTSGNITINSSYVDTHYNSNLITGASATVQSNGAVTSNGSVYMNLIENGAVRNSHNIVGSGTVTVTSDANGKITINSPSHSHPYLPLAGGNLSGHVYLTGAQESSSTASTSQIVFGTSSNNHIAISSNKNALVINPSTASTENQIVLYLNQPSMFPSGITGTLYGNATSATKATNDSKDQIITGYIRGLSVSGKTITYTRGDGTTGTITTQDTNTTYGAGTGISLSGTTFSNAGVRSISTGTTNGTISVNTNGTSANVAVKGLAAAAYKAVDTTPTSGSANVITSGGVYSALANKKNTTDKDIFYATYGSTTFAAIKAAYDAGKQVMINKISDGALSYNYVSPLLEITDTTATFQNYGVFPNPSDLLLPKGSVWFMQSTVNSSNQWSGDFNNHIGLNRTTRIDRNDTNYTTYMARGEALYASSDSTTPTYNGTIAWYYG